MFCPVIMVYFFHELTIQRGEGTIKEVIKCYFQSCFDSCRGILVKLVICVSSGQLKIKIANLMQYATLAYFLPFSNTLSLENMIGNLFVASTKVLYHIIGNSMSRGYIQNIMQWVWQDKSICLPQMNCQRLHIDGKKYSRNQSCYFLAVQNSSIGDLVTH